MTEASLPHPAGDVRSEIDGAKIGDPGLPKVDDKLIQEAKERVSLNKSQLEDRIKEFDGWRHQPGNDGGTLADWREDISPSDTQDFGMSSLNERARRSGIDAYYFISARVSVDDLERYKGILPKEDYAAIQMALWNDLNYDKARDFIPTISVPSGDEVTLPDTEAWRDQIMVT